MKNFFLSLLCFMTIATPFIVLAQAENPLDERKGFAVCNTEWDKDSSKFKDPCDFNKFMDLVQLVIDFMFYLSFPLVTIALIGVGVRYISAAASPGAKVQVKDDIRKIVIGFFWMLAAWLIITTIIKVLVDPALVPEFLNED